MKKHILVIDDEPDIRAMLTQLFEMKGYQVSAVGTAEEARRIAREKPLNLIISDVHIEDADGLVLVDQLKGMLPQVPIMLLTGVVFDPEVVQQTIGKKVASYLDKTVSLQRIAEEVRRLVGDG